jgi:hypothetical protein
MQGEDVVARISTREDLDVMKNNMLEAYVCLCLCNLFSFVAN